MALFETSYNLPDLHKYSFRLGNRATHCTSTNIIMSYTVIMLLNELIDILIKKLIFYLFTLRQSVQAIYFGTCH